MSEQALVMEHSIEADVSPAFAWKFRTDIATWHDPPATFVLDGPFAQGITGRTLMPGQDPVAWRIRDVNAGRSFTIEVPLDRATIHFEWHFSPVSERRTKLTQRIILSGSNADAYREAIEKGFGPNLAPGMERIGAAMVDASASE